MPISALFLPIDFGPMSWGRFFFQFRVESRTRHSRWNFAPAPSIVSPIVGLPGEPILERLPWWDGMDDWAKLGSAFPFESGRKSIHMTGYSRCSSVRLSDQEFVDFLS
jgi:hypothetical protein